VIEFIRVMTNCKETEMRIIFAIALVASLLAGCAASVTQGGWGEQVWDDGVVNGGSGG
jgi:hypothetical protein